MTSTHLGHEVGTDWNQVSWNQVSCLQAWALAGPLTKGP